MKLCTCGSQGKFFETFAKDPETGEQVKLIGIICTGRICQRSVFIEKYPKVDLNMKRAKEKLENSWNKAIEAASGKIENFLEYKERK